MGNWNKSNKEFREHMKICFSRLRISTDEGLVFPSLSVHCIENNEAFYLLIGVVGDRYITFFELFGLMLSPFLVIAILSHKLKF